MTTRRIAAKITGVGGYLPPRIVTNVDLQAMGIETTVAAIEGHLSKALAMAAHHVVLLKPLDDEPGAGELQVAA